MISQIESNKVAERKRNINNELNNIRQKTYSQNGKSYFGLYKSIEEYDEIINEYKEQIDNININELNYQLSQCNNKLTEIKNELYHLLFSVAEDSLEIENKEKQLHNEEKEINDNKLSLCDKIEQYKGLNRVINQAIKEKEFITKVNQKINDMKPLIELKYNKPNEYITKKINDLFDGYMTDLNEIINEILNDSCSKYAKSMTDYIKRHLDIKPLNKFISQLKLLSNTYFSSCNFDKESINSIINKIYTDIYNYWSKNFIEPFESILEKCMVISSNISNIKEANAVASCLVKLINNQFKEEGEFDKLFKEYFDEFKTILDGILDKYINHEILNTKLNELIPKSNKIQQFIKSLPTEYTSITELITLYESIVGETITNRDIGKLLKNIDGIEYKRKKVNNKLVGMYKYTLK
ncbi:hypothetical protein M9Y10_037069 [Tritrichomonas musculus]|uniref:Exocyst complex component Sec6 n=1 Tax=Tritrichomonas musculus TaxID=1915356 RepID=A0ABR2GSW2_9EUKA